jgi:hypothetical protein
METFLENIAKYLYGKYGDKLSDCALVFPNRRAGLFFTRHLSALIDKPLWLPGMFTIADLLEKVSTLKSSDPINLNFELYRVFQSVTKSKESFDEFYSWGEILLGDFDEIDKNMVDASALFKMCRNSGIWRTSLIILPGSRLRLLRVFGALSVMAIIQCIKRSF